MSAFPATDPRYGEVLAARQVPREHPASPAGSARQVDAVVGQPAFLIAPISSRQIPRDRWVHSLVVLQQLIGA